MTDKERLDENIRKDKESGAHYAPAVASRIAAAAPELSNVAEQIAPPKFPVGQGGGGGGGARALAQARSTDLSEREFQAKLASDDREFNFRAATEGNRQQNEQLKAYRDQIKQGVALTKERIALQNDLDQKTDTMDFLRKIANVSHTDPDYEDKVSNIYALHPMAIPGQINDTLQLKHAARQVYGEATKTGGSAAFEGPALESYMTEFSKSGDLLRAHAAAKRIDEGEKRLMSHVASGLLTEADFPDWDRQKSPTYRPALLNDDGTINYSAADKKAAQRAAERQTITPNKAEDSRIKELRSSTTAFMTNEEMADDPNAILNFKADSAELVDLLRTRRERTPPPKGGPPPAGGTPAPVSKRSAAGLTKF